MNSAYLLIGSNIEPVQNIQKALVLLRSKVKVIEISRAWETPSYGSPGPNFINLATQILTGYDLNQLKQNVIASIERSLKRIRTADKNAPRTIDIDIILFNDEILEKAIWELPHLILPFADLLPKLKRPADSLNLCEISQEIQELSSAKLRSDLDFSRIE
jgi:2-amino-4-hydroxy-6-hydroxymethyldihydropteridine diphosphokinase